jgi:hypothetical protein
MTVPAKVDDVVMRVIGAAAQPMLICRDRHTAVCGTAPVPCNHPEGVEITHQGGDYTCGTGAVPDSYSQRKRRAANPL